MYIYIYIYIYCASCPSPSPSWTLQRPPTPPFTVSVETRNLELMSEAGRLEKCRWRGPAVATRQ